MSLANFRNHRTLALELPVDPAPLFISGNNGTGKTSIVEAIYLLLTQRTFRQQTLADVRTIGETYLRINGVFDADATSENIRTATLFYQDERKLLINETDDYLPVVDYMFSSPVICYSPTFETLLDDEHAARRGFLDRIAFYIDKGHLARVKNYRQLLARKRAELERDVVNLDVVSVLNEQMSVLSADISNARLQVVKGISKAVSSVSLADILMPEMDLTLSVSSLADKPLENEAEKHKLLYGCHKDLLYIRRGGKVIERFQSFGQRKAVLLFLLYHSAKYLEAHCHKPVVLLLDDFEVGLDDSRREIFADLFTDTKRQTILTGVKNIYFPESSFISL
ncbi:DNA replication and repair protein RecF [Deferribacterales bacterium]|nr:DNA replication and repair protein RecF [Deferribacterales bacterium]